MTVVSLDTARNHLRESPDCPEEQVRPYLEAAEDAAAQYLNRNIYATAQALNEALQALPAVQTTVRVNYETAKTAAAAIQNLDDRRDALDIAAAVFASARAASKRTLNGIVTNPSIEAAILLTLGHLHANREDVVLAVSAAQLPLGARSLLRPYRLGSMP